MLLKSSSKIKTPFLSLVDLNHEDRVESLFNDQTQFLETWIVYNSNPIKSISSVEKSRFFSFSLSKSPDIDTVFGYLPPSSSKKDSGPVPWIYSLHGGPFGSSLDSYSSYSSLLLTEGFGYMSINYPGSFGFGSDYQASLVGQGGNLDVEDCIEAILKAEEFGLDPENLFLIGGSYGGYLISKLIEDSRLSGRIRASIMLNSVVYADFGALNTDIPEWSWATYLGKDKCLSQMVS